MYFNSHLIHQESCEEKNKYFNNFIPIKKQKVFNQQDSDLIFSETGREKTLKDQK